MKELLLTLLQLAVMTAKLSGPGGVRAVIAERLMLKQQLIVLRRARQRAPNLATDGSESTRLTWQISPRNKISASYELQPHVVFQRGYGATVSPEATSYTPYQPNYFTQAVWKSPVSARLLLEAGFARTDNDYNGRRQNALGGVDPSVDFGTVSATELSTGMVFRSAGLVQDFYAHHINRLVTTKASATYVTGSHAFKAGFALKRGSVQDSFDRNGQYTVNLLNGVPRSLIEMANPYAYTSLIRADLGLFVQDQWTRRRLTLNLGVRDDYFNSAAGAISLPATPLIPARSFAAINDVPKWNDVNPRIGASYDLFGDGKTALKVTLGRYVIGYGIAVALANNPVNTSVTSATRTWNDANGNFIPDCDLSNSSVNGECGALSDLNFGKNNPKASVWDPALLSGSGKRDYSWEVSGGIQHEPIGRPADSAH